MPETKIDVSKTALLIIDMQKDYFKPGEEQPFKPLVEMVASKGIINNITKVIAAARRIAIPIVFTTHVTRKDKADLVPSITDAIPQRDARQIRDLVIEGTPGADVVDELKPAPDDIIIKKRRGNAFYNTDLEAILRKRGIDTVIATGVQTDACVVSTVRGAQEQNFHVIVLSDCCATRRPLEQDEYFNKKIFPLVGRVRTSNEIIAAMAKASA